MKLIHNWKRYLVMLVVVFLPVFAATSIGTHDEAQAYWTHLCNGRGTGIGHTHYSYFYGKYWQYTYS